jgi:hypothetical protein
VGFSGSGAEWREVLGVKAIPPSGPTHGTTLEPVYDDMTGAVRYVSTPIGSPDPVKSPPIAAAPFYLPEKAVTGGASFSAAVAG